MNIAVGYLREPVFEPYLVASLLVPAMTIVADVMSTFVKVTAMG